MKVIFEVKIEKSVVETVEAMDMHGEDKDKMYLDHAEDLISLGEYKARFREEKEDG